MCVFAVLGFFVCSFYVLFVCYNCSVLIRVPGNNFPVTQNSEKKGRKFLGNPGERKELPPCHRADRISIEQTTVPTLNSDAVRFHVSSVSLCRYDKPRHVDDIEEKFDVLSLFNIPHPRQIDWVSFSRWRARKVVKWLVAGQTLRLRNCLKEQKQSVSLCLDFIPLVTVLGYVRIKAAT